MPNVTGAIKALALVDAACQDAWSTIAARARHITEMAPAAERAGRPLRLPLHADGLSPSAAASLLACGHPVLQSSLLVALPLSSCLLLLLGSSCCLLQRAHLEDLAEGRRHGEAPAVARPDSAAAAKEVVA